MPPRMMRKMRRRKPPPRAVHGARKQACKRPRRFFASRFRRIAYAEMTRLRGSSIVEAASRHAYAVPDSSRSDFFAAGRRACAAAQAAENVSL